MAKSNAKVNIWNRALGHIHETRLVQAETEAEGENATPEAEACALAYDDCLEQLLELYPWPFATRQVNLAKLEDVTRTGWEFAYALPADCVRAQYLLMEDQRGRKQQREFKLPFAVVDGDDNESRILVTDADNEDEEFEVLEYIGLHDHVGTMPRTFVSALAWLLASELATSLRKDTKLADYCLTRYDREAATAIAVELNGQAEDLEQDTPTLVARGDRFTSVHTRRRTT